MDEFAHTSVMPKEFIESLSLKPGDLVIDATAGGGGHSQLIHKEIGSDGFLCCIDRDPVAIDYLTKKFAQGIADNQVGLILAPFGKMEQMITESPIKDRIKEKGGVAAICADLGVSSPQLESGQRGFSFRKPGPLDMRMNQNSDETNAADIVNSYSYEELKRIFRDFGEEPKAGIIAKKIVDRRQKSPFLTTTDLADFVADSLHYKDKSRKHPATKVFQALRIEVNDELGQIEAFLQQAFDLLKPGGRLALISFHSLEDRIVKKFFRKKLAGQDPILQKLPIRGEEKGEAVLIKPFPMVPAEDEIAQNPRARSAKLRVLEKI